MTGKFNYFQHLADRNSANMVLLGKFLVFDTDNLFLQWQKKGTRQPTF